VAEHQDDPDFEVAQAARKLEKGWLSSLSRTFYFRNMRWRAGHRAVADGLYSASKVLNGAANWFSEASDSVSSSIRNWDDEWHDHQKALYPYEEPLTALRDE
jgi:hypothetical protein